LFQSAMCVNVRRIFAGIAQLVDAYAYPDCHAYAYKHSYSEA